MERTSGLLASEVVTGPRRPPAHPNAGRSLLIILGCVVMFLALTVLLADGAQEYEVPTHIFDGPLGGSHPLPDTSNITYVAVPALSVWEYIPLVVGSIIPMLAVRDFRPSYRALGVFFALLVSVSAFAIVYLPAPVYAGQGIHPAPNVTAVFMPLVIALGALVCIVGLLSEARVPIRMYSHPSAHPRTSRPTPVSTSKTRPPHR